VGRSRVAVSNLVRLLDLPDAVIEMLENGDLSEGHGRALLLAEDHDARRSLAQVAVEQGLSVRVLEERSRASNLPVAPSTGARGRTSAQAVHPDQEHAASQIAEALAGALGAEVRVKPTRDGRYRAELSFASPEEAVELARRIRPRAVA
jgi:ParB family chromosome partitioning protein